MHKTGLLNASVIDGTGREPIAGGMIVINGNVIEYVGGYEAGLLNDCDIQIDAAGMTVMPGIIDCHAHLGGVVDSDPNVFVLEDNRRKAAVSAAQARSLLEHGVTSVRDISVNGFALRSAIEDGLIKGPRIVPCGPGLSRTAGHGDAHLLPLSLVRDMHPWAVICDTGDELKKEIRKLIRQNSECIKIWASGGGFWQKESDMDGHYTQEDLELVVREAKAIGLPVAAHAENGKSALEAAKAGVSSIEHGEYLSDECIKLMLDKGIFLVPTLKLILDWDETYEPTPGSCEEFRSYTKEKLIDSNLRAMRDSFSRAVSAGVRICLGSDSFCNSLTPYGPTSHQELHYLSEYGLGPMRAITAATKTGAELLGISEWTGTLEAGKLADLIAFDADPLEDITAVSRAHLKLVIKEGEIILSEVRR